MTCNCHPFVAAVKATHFNKKVLFFCKSGWVNFIFYFVLTILEETAEQLPPPVHGEKTVKSFSVYHKNNYSKWYFWSFLYFRFSRKGWPWLLCRWVPMKFLQTGVIPVLINYDSLTRLFDDCTFIAVGYLWFHNSIIQLNHLVKGDQLLLIKFLSY